MDCDQVKINQPRSSGEGASEDLALPVRARGLSGGRSESSERFVPPDSNDTRSIAQRTVLFFLVIGISIGSLLGYSYWYMAHPLSHPEVVVVVESGSSVKQISTQLAHAGVVSNATVFRLFSRLAGVGQSLKAGEYVFADGTSLLGVFRKLKRGEFRVFRITIPEGWTAKEIAGYLGKQPFAKEGFADEFLKAAASSEGQLFPDTYDIHRPRSVAEIAQRLTDEFHKRFTPEMEARAKEMGLTVQQVVTLASIIEKETGAAEERPLVSSVFHNRLEKNMPLASDPTVIYGLPNFDGNLRKADLSNPHLYNTYVHAGLPPSPIANPGLASLQAALYPAKSDYLYFVSRNDGSHAFATTYAEHVRNVGRYQQRRQKR